jgi:CheY-like chemotaxis protein
VLALTANARQEDVDASRAAGCNTHISKPISQQKLLLTLKEYISNADLRKAPPSLQLDALLTRKEYIQKTAAQITPSLLQIDVPRGLEAAAKQYIQKRKDEIPHLIQFLEQQNFEQLRLLAHNMKGTGTSYGFPELTRLGRLLEDSAKEKNADIMSQQLVELSKYIQDAINVLVS